MSASSYIVTISKGDSTITVTDSNAKTLSSSTDATNAIQAAVNAIKSNTHGGGTIHINAGTYSINSTYVKLSGTNNITIEGDTRENIILRVNYTDGKIFVKSDNTQTHDMTL